ncbi:hypothetical protein BC828DRAFT_393209 [Blastocladiella britannica]|nr:hypothetical protein BC828DRAFT_393209 [Blastocladiella britannica]
MLAVRSTATRALVRPASVVSMRANSTLPDPAAKKLRPMSPDLQIYNWDLTNTMSAAHRVTGFTITGAMYIAGWAVAAGYGSADIAAAAATVPTSVLIAGKAALVTPFWFHTFNGLRHLVWDTGRALTLDGVYKTGYAVQGATALATVASLLV